MLNIPDDRKRYLARILRKVADKHDEMRYAGEVDRLSLNKGCFASGICLACEAAAEDAKAAGSEYGYLRIDINTLLLEMQDGYEKGGFLDPQPYGSSWKDWNQRATMCLLMAHKLEDSL